MLAQALDASHPLLERVKFLAIVATNLDEFFMIRVSTTLKKLKEGIEDVAPDGYDTAQQLFAMRERAHRMLDEQADCWAQLRPLLAAEGIHFLETGDRTPAVREFLATQFSREIFKVNAVTDDQMIRVLYRASQAGASIDLICRGIPPWCSILREAIAVPSPGQARSTHRSSCSITTRPASSARASALADGPEWRIDLNGSARASALA